MIRSLLTLLLLIPSLSFSNEQKIYDEALELFEQYDNRGAIELFLKIPENINAQYFLGLIYDNEKDFEKSLYWYEKCGSKGDVDCQFNASLLEEYENKNLEKSNYWLELCSNKGEAYCQNNLAHRYDNGIYVTENKNIAYELFLKSADQGLSNAYTSIAAYYLDGDAVNQSYSKAFEYYKLGANAEYGNTERAIYGLALMYEKGLGTKVNYQKAKELYLEAHDLGHQLSLNRINAIEGDAKYAIDFAEKYKTGSDVDLGIPIDYEDSAFFYKIAEFKGAGDPDGFQELIDIIDQGSFGRQWDKAADRFEIWKSNLGFTDPDTLNDITEYFLNHIGTASYINSNYLITNKHITHSDDYPYTNKCDKLIGFDPYSNNYEEYEVYNSLYLPNTLDIDVIYNPIETQFKDIFVNTNNPRLGEGIISIGFPQGNSLSKYPKITSGMVTSDFGYGNNPDEFLIDATSYGGSSGSPIFNNFNELTGILWGGPSMALGSSSDAETIVDPNIAFVVKSTYVMKFLDLNEISYSLNNSELERDTADIVENNINRLRLIECYTKFNKFN